MTAGQQMQVDYAAQGGARLQHDGRAGSTPPVSPGMQASVRECG
jgi:hypothetical protein